MYLPFITLLFSVSVSNAQINALASVLEFADSGDFETDQFSVLERPEEKSGLDWSDEEEALISEFASILSTTPKDQYHETTRLLMFSEEGDEKTAEDDFDEATFSQSSETPRSLFSSTNRAIAEQQNSIVQSRTPKTFADLLPEKSLNPPQLEQATSFEDLLRPPVIFEDTENGRKKIDLDKKRLMIQEALQRIKNSRSKSKFPPKLPDQPDIEDDRAVSINTQKVTPENKFEDYDDLSTWGPVTTVEEYNFDPNNENGDEENLDEFKKFMEEHTESNFGLDILNAPNRMESTLLKLLGKKNNNLDDTHQNLSNPPTKHEKDPLNNDLREFAANDDYRGSVPRPHQNPFLSLLNPSTMDYSNNIFSVPEYKQDPFLRQLRKNPKKFQDDFLSLPSRDQNQLLKMFMKAGRDIEIGQLLPPDYRQNPLLRILVPQVRDNIGNLSPPDIRDSGILKEVMEAPGKFANDFLLLSDEDKKEVLDAVDSIDDGSFEINLLVPNKSERLRIVSNHSFKKKDKKQTKNKNPLLDILEGDKRDQFDKQTFDVPMYKQDPLMRQLRIHPEQFKDDFLELPERKQDTLLKLLKKSGIPRWNIDRLTPPDFEHNPLMRMLKDTDSGSVMKDVVDEPESFKEDFENLASSEKLKVVDMLMNNETPDEVMAILVPDRKMRLELMIKNPLERFIVGSEQDELDKTSLTPPKYRQDPLLRQLRLQPEMYHNDFLELPRRKQDTLLKLLKSSGLESKLMERLIPPGQRQDPLLRALIGNSNKKIVGLEVPKHKQNPLLRMLLPDKRDKFDKEHLDLPEKERIFKDLIDNPSSFSSDFKELPAREKIKVLEMVKKAGKDTEIIMKSLSPEKFEKLRIEKDPLLKKSLPKYTQSDAFRELNDNKKDSMLQEILKNPSHYEEAFDKLPSHDQESLIEILRAETGQENEDFFKSLEGSPTDKQAQRLLSFYQWSKELMTKLNQNYWDQIKTVLGQVIRENLGDNVPPPKKFSELVDGEEFSFKVKVEEMIKKLKKMDEEKSDPQNFDDLMQSFISNAKSESKETMKMNSKVMMVDNLVKMFIKGNALRAKIMKEKLKKPRKETFSLVKDEAKSSRGHTSIPKRINLMKVKEDFEPGMLSNVERVPTPKNPLLRLLRPTGRDEFEKHQLIPPKAEQENIVEEIVKNPEDFSENFLSLPQRSQNDVVDAILKKSMSNIKTVRKLAPLTIERNPLLRILDDKTHDDTAKDVLNPPSYKQDPLLRQLEENPESYSDDFLELPQVMQEKVVEILKSKGIETGMESLTERKNRNPLARLLTPNFNDEQEKNKLLPPEYRQDPLLRQLKKNPENYNNDFLELPMRTQDLVIDQLEKKGVNIGVIEDLTKGDRNPLNQLLTKGKLRKQDPLLRQLKTDLESYKDDILQLPSKKQDTLLKILRNEGITEKQIKSLLPPRERQNPLLRLLRPDFKDQIERQQLSLPKYKQNPLLRQLVTEPEEYSADFLSLPLAEQDDLIEVIEDLDPRFPGTNKLAPLQIERNPLKRLLEPDGRDERDKNNLTPPRYKQDPLLRQLTKSPLSFESDILELPQDMKTTLMRVLKEEGSSKATMEELQKLIGGEFPSLEELFTIKSEDELQTKILKLLKEKPSTYSRIFSKLFHHSNLFDFQHTRKEIEEMIKKDPVAVSKSFSKLIIEQQPNFSSTESSTPKVSIPVTSLFTTTRAPKADKKPRIKVLTQIIKKPKNGSSLRNTNFSPEKIEKLRSSVRPENRTDVTTEIVFKKKNGEIIPKSKVQLPKSQDEALFFPDRHLIFQNRQRIPKPQQFTASPLKIKEVKTDRAKIPVKEDQPRKELSLAEDFDLPQNVLSNMLRMIEDGNLSKEEVIEHLINNGFLPVEVTEFGKLPISIGSRKANQRIQPSLKENREEVSSARIEELTTTVRIPFDERRKKIQLKSIDINDPDFDFERINPEAFTNFGSSSRNRQRHENLREEELRIVSSTEANPLNTTTFIKVDEEEMEKIEAVMTMIRMFEDNQISENELLQMMSQMGDDIIGNTNSNTEFTMFSDLDMPVKTSFTNMVMPVQERPPVNPDVIEFPDETINNIADPFNQNVVPPEPLGQDIKPFTSFGSEFQSNHNSIKSTSESGIIPIQPAVITTEPTHTLFYDDLSNQQIHLKLPNGFPDFNSFDLKHQEVASHHSKPSKGYLPPPPPPLQKKIPVAVQEHTPVYHDDQKYYHNSYHTQPVYEEEGYLNQHYQELHSALIAASPISHQHPYSDQYSNVNDRPFQFDEMSHEVFAPREPFGPPASILPQFTPAQQYRELPVPESKTPSYVKSLPDYPAYGAYNSEGYHNYPAPVYPAQQDTHPYEHHIPSPEYIPSDVVHHPPVPEQQSPLYLHHGPQGYNEYNDHSSQLPVPVYTPQSQAEYYTGPEYGPRRPRAPILGLPDHNTDKPFAYDDPPLSPLTGHREIDRTIGDIHQAFLDGDEMKYHAG